MNFSLYIAKRYIFSKSKNTAINSITRIASAGIIIGAMALFVVLSVFSGLKDFSLSFSNDFDPDLKVTATKGKSFLISERQQEKLLKILDETFNKHDPNFKNLPESVVHEVLEKELKALRVVVDGITNTAV